MFVSSLNLVQLTGLGDSLLRKCLKEGSLVALGVDELVVEDLDVGVLGGEKRDLVGDGLGVGEGGNVTADAREGELDILGVGPRQLGTALLADDDQVRRALLGKKTADTAGQTRVNTTAKTTVGRADNDEGLLLLGFGDLGLGSLEDLLGGLTVLAGVVHGPLRAGELGGSDNLHGVGDLLHVLQAALDFSERRVAGSTAGGSSNPRGNCSRKAGGGTGCARQHLVD